MGALRPQIPPRLQAVLHEYLKGRTGKAPISIADIHRRVRYSMPDIQASDDDLDEMIAGEIIANGGNVEFDGHSGS